MVGTAAEPNEQTFATHVCSGGAGKYGAGVAERYRCSACGNLTRFDVEVTRRTRAFHHYTIGGALSVEEEEVLEERVERITCRWCGASGAAIEALSGAGDLLPEQLHDQAS